MITLQQENGLTFADLNELHEWEKNPKIVDAQDFADLKAQIDLGEFKPLLVMEDGTILGGNTRVKAYREKSITRPWVSIVRFETDAETGKVVAFVNGKKAKRTFEDFEQAKLEYALADNDNKGRYDSQALAELAYPYREVMPLEQYKISLAYPVKLQSVLDAVGPAKPLGENAPELPPTDRDADEETTDDKLDTYLNGSIRQIVLYFTVDEYEPTLDRLANILEEQQLKSNTDVFMKLLDFWEAHPELHPEPAQAESNAVEEAPAEEVVDVTTNTSNEG